MKHETILIIMPTENISTLGQPISNLEYCEKGFDPHVVHNFNLYATVSQDVEPIKEGDNIFNRPLSRLEIASKNCEINLANDMHYSEGKKRLRDDIYKVIAATDLKLKNTISIGIDGTSMFKAIPQLQQSTIKEFVANPNKKFKVEYEGKHEYGKYLHNKPGYVYVTKLKVNEDNTVSTISVKETYTQEQIRLSFQAGARRGYCQRSIMSNVGATCKEPDEDTWIKENL